MPSLLAKLPVVGRFFKSARPTSEDVRDYWTDLYKRWDVQRIDKDSSSDMQAVANVLGMLEIVDKNDFLKKFTTTLGNRIYTPFKPGVPTEEWPLWSQIKVGDHEVIHVQQDRAAGGLGFEWSYLTNPAQRAHYESEAYRSEFVLEWRFNGRMPDPDGVAALLGYYGCSTTDVAVAKVYFQRSIPSIKTGAIANDVTRWTVNWLENRWRA